jgi:hypothetical protein
MHHHDMADVVGSSPILSTIPSFPDSVKLLQKSFSNLKSLLEEGMPFVEFDYYRICKPH